MSKDQTEPRACINDALLRARERLAAATPAPWVRDSCGYGSEGRQHWISGFDFGTGEPFGGPPDSVIDWHEPGVADEDGYVERRGPSEADIALIEEAPGLLTQLCDELTLRREHCEASEEYIAAKARMGGMPWDAQIARYDAARARLEAARAALAAWKAVATR